MVEEVHSESPGPRLLRVLQGKEGQGGYDFDSVNDEFPLSALGQEWVLVQAAVPVPVLVGQGPVPVQQAEQLADHDMQLCSLHTIHTSSDSFDQSELER